jgi:uncharacterized protein (TIGR00375 family)
MRFIADLQIHSKYSRATSKNMIFEEIDRWAGNKGILVMGTGDFTHPLWFREIKEKLEPAEPGLFRLKKNFRRPTLHGGFAETRFLLEVEVSNIYSRKNRVYRVHNMIFVPDLETAGKINNRLSKIGNLASDGRPILGLDSEELAKIVFDINPQSVIVPAHCWTPWFSVFGSMSGFNSLDECFGNYSKYIFSIETGLSSDPAMNWRLSQLDNITLISNSDSHSLAKIGREANILDTELSYDGIIDAFRSRDPNRFIATIEFFPEEGKYHLDGHRACNIVFEPQETIKNQGLCPRCGNVLTIGVLNRIEQLADRPPVPVEVNGYLHRYKNKIPFYNLVPLDEIISKIYGVGITAVKVRSEYARLLKLFGGEFQVLMETSVVDLEHYGIDEAIIRGIMAVRNGQIKFDPPGYDGEYGKMVFLNSPLQVAKESKKSQRSLF